MENQRPKEKILDEYSWWKVHCYYTKLRAITFIEEFIKNFQRIQWSDKKRVIRETCFVLIVAGILTSFFYFVFLFMWLVTS
ncbi:putative preprotein translocase subunit SecE [Mycoplasma suis KI3806]|uniref:Preprotein translocase subunit SecE n=1 Tax=Mycoplasma suis (strain KI_3806) TaxID=708248 RepID=F0V2N1_MYCS3|nr:preprotein translocase subunit SecE [Mycoplasma suis]CBZ40103.1 putative preprotein translocase subunit SecE [Mycoplasma suis KI3806]